MRIFFHPQRGVIVHDEDINPRSRRYRGGSDGDWRELREPLPKGFLAGDPSKQIYGLGGPELFYGPLEKKCRDCRAEFIFTAEEQRYWYETLGFWIDATAVRCPTCRRARQSIEEKRRAYEVAVRMVEAEASPANHLAAATAALELARAGQGTRRMIERAIGHARRAGPTGEPIREALRALRDSR